MLIFFSVCKITVIMINMSFKDLFEFDFYLFNYFLYTVCYQVKWCMLFCGLEYFATNDTLKHMHTYTHRHICVYEYMFV